VDEEDRLFERVFSEMSREDALYFREAMRDGLYPENIELFNKAFVIDWRGANIKNVRVLKRFNKLKVSFKTKST
jgi:hypothetical protein